MTDCFCQRIGRDFKVISREDEESQFPDRLRNLSITPSDDEHIGITTRESKKFP